MNKTTKIYITCIFFVKETGLQLLNGVRVSECEVELGPVGAGLDQNKTIRTALKTMKALQ